MITPNTTIAVAAFRAMSHPPFDELQHGVIAVITMQGGFSQKLVK
jgi:hypothetical protein